MANLIRLKGYTPRSGKAGQVKFYETFVLSGTEKTDWIEVPVTDYDLALGFYMSFHATGSGRVIYTPESLEDIKNTSNPDDVPFNIWPYGTVDETSIAVPNSFKEDAFFATFTAFRLECFSGNIKIKVISN